MIELYHGKAEDIMPVLPQGCADAVIADIPYGTTACAWDTVIPFDVMWKCIRHVIKPKGAVVLFGSQPFTSALVMSNPQWFKYELIWDKCFGRQPQLANVQPMKRHENVIVFGKAGITYNPQRERLGKPYKSSGANNFRSKNNHQLGLKKRDAIYEFKTPDTLLIFKPVLPNSKVVHPTQKPVALMEYLIKTYTNEGETVVDFTMGSGTTGVAAYKTGRNFIGIEKAPDKDGDPDYFAIAKRRIEQAQMQPALALTG